jgi:hypothetical protein
MSQQPRPQPQPPAAAPISNVAEAERVIANLHTIMDRLVENVERETASARLGRLRKALAADSDKAELARAYSVEAGRVKAATDFMAKNLPEALDRLRQRHDTFRALLQTNLTVLATAHAVSEGIIRGVSGELARKQTPSTYSASGLANGPSSKSSPPLAISRSL